MFSHVETTSTPPEIMPSLLANPQSNHSYSPSLLAIFLPLIFRGETAAIAAASAVILAFSAAAVAFFTSLSASACARTAASAFVGHPRRFLAGGSPLVSGIGGSWVGGRGCVG